MTGGILQQEVQRTGIGHEDEGAGRPFFDLPLSVSRVLCDLFSSGLGLGN